MINNNNNIIKKTNQLLPKTLKKNIILKRSLFQHDYQL